METNRAHLRKVTREILHTSRTNPIIRVGNENIEPFFKTEPTSNFITDYSFTKLEEIGFNNIEWSIGRTINHNLRLVTTPKLYLK